MEAVYSAIAVGILVSILVAVLMEPWRRRGEL